MKPATIFFGAARSAWAVARIELQRHVRSLSFWLLVLCFPLALMAHQQASGLDDAAQKARFLDYALGLIGGLLPLVILLATIMRHGASERHGALDDATRLAGEGAAFWGKAIGVSLVAILLSLLCGAATIIEFSRRFDEAHGKFLIRPHVTATDTAFPVFLRKVGDDVNLRFDFDTSNDSTQSLTARFHPRITITKDGWPTRGALPVRLVFTDAASGWERKRTAVLYEGSPTEVQVRLPKSSRPQSVQVRIESIHAAALLRIESDSLTLLGGGESLYATVLRGVLLLALLAAAIATWALFFLHRWSIAVAAFASAGCWALSVSLTVATRGEVFGGGWGGSFLLGIAGTLLPDLSAHDPADLIPRGRGVQWGWIIDSGIRLIFTVGALGMLHAWLPSAGRFIRMAKPKPIQAERRSGDYPVAAVARRREPRSWPLQSYPRVRWALGACLVIALLFTAARGSLRESSAFKEAHPNIRRNVWPGALPFRLELLWSEADALAESGRYWELVDVFQKIARLEPENPRIWFHQAYTMAYDIGQSQRGATRRWRWYRRAIVHATAGAQAHPDNWRLAVLRFNLWRRLVATDREVDRICRRQLGHDGLYEAMAVAGEMRDRHGDRPGAWFLYLGVGQDISARLLLNGDIVRARVALELCLQTERDMQEHFPNLEGGALAGYVSWGKTLAALEAVPTVGPSLDLPLFQSAMQVFWQAVAADAARKVPSDLDDVIIPAVHFRLIRLCQDLCAAEMNLSALRILAQVRRIFAVAARVDEVGNPYHDTGYINLLEQFIQVDAELLSARAAKSDRVAELTRVWGDQLAALALHFSEGTGGRRDGFDRRMRRARP